MRRGRLPFLLRQVEKGKTRESRQLSPWSHIREKELRDVVSDCKVWAYKAGDLSSIPESGRSLREGNDYPLEYSCWRIPWTEEPGGLQSTVSQRVGHNWATKTFRFRVSLKRLGLGLSRRSYVPLVGYRSWNSVRTRLERPIWKTSGQGWDQWGPFSSSLSPSCAFRGTESALAFDLEKEGKIIRGNNLKTTWVNGEIK